MRPNHKSCLDMRLVIVFLLIALPVCCYAGSSGCTILDNIIITVINSSASVKDFQEVVDPYVLLPATNEAMGQVKQCFLDQSNETLANVQLMEEAINNSEECTGA